MLDELFMIEALKEAEISLIQGNYPIGSVIVLDNHIISRGQNLVKSSNDKLAHAEFNGIQHCKDLLLKKENRGRATLYTTYSPCPMCFGVIVLYHIGKIVWGTDLDNSGAVYFNNCLPEFYKNTRKKIEIVGHVLEDKCNELILKSGIERLKNRV
ncbi:nucleoside deaminase [Candidatus Pacearchaeota archaeon]|jgi:cytosine deaminase|nr:nucleoside deaminase [Candidatus Pacearchaeota archaeon]